MNIETRTVELEYLELREAESLDPALVQAVDATGLVVPDDDFEIRLQPGATDRPAYERATDLGIFRMAFLVDDAADAVESIRAAGHPCPDPVWLDMGPTIPLDGLRGAFFRDPDGTCLELIEAPAA